MSMRCTWQGAALLTAEEMEVIRRGRGGLGIPRNLGLEFVTIWTHGQPVAALEVHVGLPPEYAPDKSQVKVVVHDHSSREEDFRGDPSPDAAELSRRVRFLAPGRYSLRVPFPRVDRSYTLAWTPVLDQKVADEVQNEKMGDAFGEMARKHRAILLATFAEVFRHTPLWGRATLALFAKAAKSGALEHLRCVRLEDDPDALSSLDTVYIKSENHLLVRAWWGYMVSLPRPAEDEKAQELGFLPNEVRLLCVPIRLGLRATNPSPWLIARLGIEKEAVDLLGPMADSIMSLFVYQAISCLLATAFQLLGEDHGSQEDRGS